jgi:hypothetical protein
MLEIFEKEIKKVTYKKIEHGNYVVTVTFVDDTTHTEQFTGSKSAKQYFKEQKSNIHT